MKKNILLTILIFFFIFLIPSTAFAQQIKKEDRKIVSCVYNVISQKNFEKYPDWITVDLMYEDKNHGQGSATKDHGFKIKYIINGKEKATVKSNSMGVTDGSYDYYYRIQLTNTCPKNLVYNGGSGTDSFDLTDEGDTSHIYSSKKSLVYHLKTGTNTDNLAYISRALHNMHSLEEYNSSGNDKTYTCSYNPSNGSNSLEITLSASYTDAVNNAGNYGYSLPYAYFYPNGKTGNNNTATWKDYVCPSVVYEIKIGSTIGYVYHGGWPKECVKGEAQCRKWTRNGDSVTYEEYKVAEPPIVAEPIKATATYNAVDAFSKFDPNDVLTVKYEISADGKTINDIYLELNGSKVYQVASSTSDIENLILNTSNSGSSMPARFDCFSANLIGNKNLVAGGVNNTIPSGYNGKVCKAVSSSVTVYNSIGQVYYNVNENVTGLSIETMSLQDIVDNFENMCVSCLSNSSNSGCDNFTNKAYDRVQLFVKKCKVMEGNGLYESDNCQAMLDQLNNWAKKGCFGNRVIVAKSDSFCASLGGLSDWLEKIYTIIKFAVPILIIAMGIKDFIQALSSGKDDALKKAGSTFIKRLIVGAVFVVLPILIEMILTLALGGSFADMCITI